MARRTKKTPSRLELRKAEEAAEKLEESGESTITKKKAVRKKTPRKKATKKKVESGRVRIVWGVFDNSNQKVATFPYTERDKANTKAAELTEKGRGPYFVQPVKEPIAEPDEVE